MVARAEAQEGSKLDILKFMIAIALLIGGVVQFYYFEEESQLYRVLALLGFVIFAMGVVYTTRLGHNLWLFARDVRKVVWPTRQETMQTTLMVIIMVLLVGIMLWLIDMVLRWAVLVLTGQGG